MAEARHNGAADPLEDSAWVLANETALIDALVTQHAVTIWQPFAIPRYQIKTPEGERALTIRVRGLSQAEIDRCDKRAQVPTGRRLAGGGREMKRNDTLYGQLAIVAATHPDDAARLWGSAKLRERLGVAGDTDVVATLLSPGEQARISTEIADLSGFLPGDDEVAKSVAEGGR